MLNCVYRLIAPRTFEPVEVEASTTEASHVVVRPTHLSICNADMRYYLGNRSAEALAKKLPMALIHEGIGEVVFDPTSTFRRGEAVVMLPNNPHESNPFIAENYLQSSEFCGSGFDGFMQEYVLLSPRRLVSLPVDIDKNVAAFTELVSVAVHAVTRFGNIAHGGHRAIGVWGDGNLGFIVSLILRMQYPDARIVVVGRNDFKLDDFTFVDETRLTYELDDGLSVDHAFECCGGDGTAAAIDQIIGSINPEGTISLLGVSENLVPINTRMVLEKGLRFFGSSRSGRQDFVDTIELYKRHPETLRYLSALVGNIVDVNSIASAAQAFEVDLRKGMGKTIMRWYI